MGDGKFKHGNPGRPKGAVNKKTQNLREKINEFLNNQWGNLIESYNELDARDKFLFFEKLLQYGLPKLQATSLTMDFEKLNEEQLDEIINALIQKSNEQERKS